MFAEVNGARLFFDVEGAGLDFDGPEVTKKPVLICLHGSFFNHSGFRPFLSPLSKHCQLIYIDFPGFGRSGTCEPEAWRLDQLANSVVGLMDHLALKTANLAGHSFGALVANHIAIHYPERVDINILLNPPAVDFDYFLKEVESGGGAAATEAVNALLLNKDTDAVEAFFAHAAPLYFQHPPNPDWMARAQLVFPLLFASFDQVVSYDWYKELSNLAVETWLCYGEKDIYHPVQYFEDCLAELNNPHLRIFAFEQSGHFLFNDELEKLLDLLKTLPGNNQ